MNPQTFSLEIKPISENRREYMPLLLLGDECEAMVEKYIGSGEMYVGFIEGEAVAVCVTVAADEQTTEVKNLAVAPRWQKHGIGRRMLAYAEAMNSGKDIILGTGETPSTLRFYRSCGYEYSHRVKDFFTDNYPGPIVEEGVLLKDMVYLRKKAR